jgi:Tfp pilus assembly protein FimT
MELMTTIAIIGILAAIAVPNVIAWRNNSQLNASTRRVKDTIEATRMAAIKSNLPADVIFNAATSYDTQTRNVMAGVVALRPIVTHQLAPGVTITFNNGGQIAFNNRGMTGNNGTITLQHANGLSRQIVVSILGSSVIQ